MNSEIKNVEKRLKMLLKVMILYYKKQHFIYYLRVANECVQHLFFLVVSLEKITEDTYHVAVALELIHMATLVHDDVIDKSDKRRGKLTIEKMGCYYRYPNWQFLTSFRFKTTF